MLNERTFLFNLKIVFSMPKITAVIQTCTGNFSKSKTFYQKLAFESLSKDEPTLFTDGKFLLEINPENTARTGLKLYQTDWQTTVTALSKVTKVVPIEGGYLVSDPNGVKVYLMDGEMTNDYQIAGESKAIPGNFAGLSIEAVDVEKTVQFWEIIGYKKTMGSLEQGWIAFENGTSIGVSIMKPMVCPHLFFTPGLTFFNGGKNLPIIEKIKAANIPITEEITVFNKEGVVDNVIICDPGGLGFFIFND